MIRSRTTKDHLKIVKQLDAFSKIPEECKSTSEIGGLMSIISRIIIVYLIYNEINYYLDSEIIFKFVPDIDMDTKLKIHIDLTVATPCRGIGADILDSTNQNIFSFGVLQEDDAWWELSTEQQDYFNYMKHFNDYLRESYHSLAEVLYKHNRKFTFNLPERTVKPDKPYDACRIHGSLTLNKVAGNFHITGGKSLHFPHGHLHITSLFDNTRHNFSHRINRFSFGDASAGVIHPLDGDEKIFEISSMMCQYFIEVVPTDVETLLHRQKTFQYSVKENTRPIDHQQGSHGVPGLYFKYDVSALKVLVKQDRENLLQFIVRLSSITAGIIVISGMINTVLQIIFNCFKSITSGDPMYQQINVEKTLLSNNSDTIKNSNNMAVDAASVAQAIEPSRIKNTNLLLTASISPEVICDFTVTKPTNNK